MTLKERIEKIKNFVGDKEIDLHSEGNYPILEPEDMTLTKDYIVRFVGERCEAKFELDGLDELEVEIIEELLEDEKGWEK